MLTLFDVCLILEIDPDALDALIKHCPEFPKPSRIGYNNDPEFDVDAIMAFGRTHDAYRLADANELR